jgi:hypothetical protein
LRKTQLIVAAKAAYLAIDPDENARGGAVS